MDAGLAHMPHSVFANTGLGLPTSGLATRRGSQNIKPLSLDGRNPIIESDNGVPTPRTSRSHLLAGLRTAPKSSTATTFPTKPHSPPASTSTASHGGASNGNYKNVQSGPKTSMPRLTSQQQQNYNAVGYNQLHYTADQVLAPPDIQIHDHEQDTSDPYQAQLLATNVYLAQQQQRLQQQLLALQAAAQNLSIGGSQGSGMPQTYQSLYHQQPHLQGVHSMVTAGLAQPNIYAVYDPMTGQQTYYIDQSQAAQLNNSLLDYQQQQQQQLSQLASLQLQQQQILMQQHQHQQQQQQQQQHQTPRLSNAPRVQVSPPPAENNRNVFRNPSPPRRFDSPAENVTPLPPASANAFRRGHKKATSIAFNKASAASVEDVPKSAGPRTPGFPGNPLAALGTYGPGQARAGEHPVRQPRGPPSFDELSTKPTAKHDGSKNFVARTRRSAINNLVRAGLERRKEARSSGSVSPISESTEEMVETPMTDNESESGRSGSGSLVGEMDDADCSLPSSRTSTGSWGAIGSDRPISRQKMNRQSVDSNSLEIESSTGGSFASLLKNPIMKAEAEGPQRRAPMLVLTSAEKRKTHTVA